MRAVRVGGYLSGRSPDAEAPMRMPILAARDQAGFLVGRNIGIEYRFAEGREERLPMLASDSSSSAGTLLVATDRPSTLAVKATTTDDPHRLWHWL